MIVGPHGAGLANMVWATTGTKVVEISVSPTGTTPANEFSMVARLFGSHMFRSLAAACGHRYERVVISSSASATYGDASEAEAQILELLI